MKRESASTTVKKKPYSAVSVYKSTNINICLFLQCGVCLRIPKVIEPSILQSVVRC